jgi:hypothetical protein
VELAKLNPNWRRRALSSARLLDEVVDNQVSLLPRLPEGARSRAGEHLAELVMLAQAYRHYAAGWISGRELRRRGKATLARLELVRDPLLEQLTERE